MSGFDLVIGIVLFTGGTLALSMIQLGWKIFKADPEEFDRNKLACRKWYDPIIGTLSTFPTGLRDHRVNAGLAVNKEGMWMEQGKLADSSVDAILR